MASDGPLKNDILAIFKRLRGVQTNKQCFDCSASNPTWASVTYGVFLCIDCSAVHRSLGVHVTFIRSTQLDTSWTWTQLRAMQLGGNAAGTAFFRQHGCTSNDAQQKYHSRAAQMYREKLHSLALKAMKLHGTKIHIDSAHSPDATSPSPRTKEVDFFKEHQVHGSTPAQEANGFTTRSTNGNGNGVTAAEPIPVSNGARPQANGEPVDPTAGPNVDAALSMSPSQALQQAEPRKATIGSRKPASAAKKGMGTKKGLGAQKVKANFNDIENAAQQRDRDKDQLTAMAAAQEAHTKEQDSKRIANMKLAYKDLGVEEKKRDEKMKTMDPKKKEQVERLGMGFGGSRESSHSAISEMKTIEQTAASIPTSRTTLDSLSSRTRDYNDDFEVVTSGYSSGLPKYNENPFLRKSEDRYLKWTSNGSSTWDSADKYESKSSTAAAEEISSHSKNYDEDRGRARKNFEVSGGDDAQQKFGNAKSISSDAYFGKYDPDLETKQKLSTYSGSSGISSADLFGPQGGSGGSRGRSNQYNDYGGAGPDLADIKEGVRQGVSKVAGKLSNIANGVMNSIQRN